MTTNSTFNATTLYLLEDGTTHEIVRATTSVEALVEAFYSYVSENSDAVCRFYKLVNGNVIELDDNELPAEFLYGYDDEDAEYDDCAYCPVCKAWYI